MSLRHKATFVFLKEDNVPSCDLVAEGFKTRMLVVQQIS